MRAAWLAGLAALAPLTAAAAPGTGVYVTGLMIGYDRASGVVSGYFSVSESAPPMLGCIFYMRGDMEGAVAQVDTFDPADPSGDLIKGTLTVQSPVKVLITLPTDHAGCTTIFPFANGGDPSAYDYLRDPQPGRRCAWPPRSAPTSTPAPAPPTTARPTSSSTTASACWRPSPAGSRPSTPPAPPQPPAGSARPISIRRPEGPSNTRPPSAGETAPG
jgi:hypothetical protein